MNKIQFLLLTSIEKSPGVVNLKEFCCKSKIDIETANKTINELKELGYLCNYKVSEKGLEALEPYRVKRAIFIAAGMGTRMMPITLSCPKPLVRVNGVRIIDTLIDACVDAGIEEIIVVRGYMRECFNNLRTSIRILSLSIT